MAESGSLKRIDSTGTLYYNLGAIRDARTIGIEKLQGEVRTDLISVKNVDIDGLFQKDGRCVAYGTKRLVYSEKPWIMLVDENGAKTEKVLDLPDAETIVTVIDDGGNGIVWDLCMVSRAYYSPFTSSFSFECLCSVVQCRIGDDGELAEKAVTDFCVSETF